MRRFPLVLLFAAGFVQAVETPLSVPTQYRLLRKVLSFDRNLRSRSEKGIILGIAYAGDIAYSTAVRDELLKIVSETEAGAIEGLPVRAVPVEFTTPREFAAGLAEEGVNLLYIAPVDENDLKAILPICVAKRIPTVAGLASYIPTGVAVVLNQAGGGHEIFVNLEASRTQGFNFSARFLNLSRIHNTTLDRAGFRP